MTTERMPDRQLGVDGPVVGAIGLGCMGMTYAYEMDVERDDPMSIAVIREVWPGALPPPIISSFQRASLEAAGHRFRTSSDTEVIVHAYEEWREQAFRRFNGQWAVALWDAERQSLTLARDPYGVRPLYVAEHAGRTGSLGGATVRARDPPRACR